VNRNVIPLRKALAFCRNFIRWLSREHFTFHSDNYRDRFTVKPA
jgi:hypothetical protein